MHTNPKLRSKSTSLPPLIAVAMFAILTITVQASAQKFIVYEAPGAGTGAGQGTIGFAPGAPGTIIGYYFDADSVSHGMLWHGEDNFTTFEAPGAGNSANQGTFIWGGNIEGTTTGSYIDPDGAYHGFMRDSNGKITTFDAPGAGTGANQGTFSANISAVGTITGWYVDAENVMHGFLRDRDGKTTSFDAPGAGTSAGQGTQETYYGSINLAGAITGNYIDASNVYHIFVRNPDGKFFTIDAPRRGYWRQPGNLPPK
jgi:hypothetical protein